MPMSDNEFIQLIRDLAENTTASQKPISPPLFRFEMTDEAKNHNERVLASFDYDLARAIEAQNNSPVSYGSEFRDWSELEPLLCRHPFWKQMKTILRYGASFPLNDISQDVRDKDNAFILARGNHKSIEKGINTVRQLITEDVTHGHSLPLPLHCVDKIKNSSIAPIGVVTQETLNERGERIPKFRLTHDQSFPGPSGLSVNKRVQHENLPPCLFGFCLQRILHYIVHTRLRHPLVRILIGKYDIKSAYRRAHISATTAAESLMVLDDTLFLALRMTFGGAPCPSLWGCISETVCDLANDLIHCDQWHHSDIFSSNQHRIQDPHRLPDHIPFKQARELDVELPSNDKGIVDILIDDNIPVCPDLHDNAERVAAAVPLALHCVGRPLAPFEPIPRDDLLSLSKLRGEGRMEEIKLVLGWQLDTRRLLVQLPENKFLGWSTDISTVISNGKLETKALESLLGRLNHVAFSIPMMRHFLNRLRHLLDTALRAGWRWCKLTQESIDDLRLCTEFLQIARNGMSMNNLVFRKPTHLYRSDACEYGMGGYSITSGHAWRFRLPVDCFKVVHINSLEFAAALITIWVDLIDERIVNESCILSQTDNSSAAGWLLKSNFCPEDQGLQMHIARKLARVMMQGNSCLYSQWFPGEDNKVADCLSRMFDLPDSVLSDFLLNSYPEQLPNGAATARSNAVTDETTKSQDRSFRRWIEFLHSIGLGDDVFLDSLKRDQRVWIIVCFAQALREGRFSSERHAQLACGSVKKAIGELSAVFRTHGRPNPTYDDDGKPSVLLHRQYRGYTNRDPAEKPQQAITASILRKMCKLAGSNHIDQAMSQLLIGGFYFATRSCEICEVTGDRRTKILTLANLRFFLGKRQLQHTDINLSLADTVSITFEYQKRDQRNDTITAHRTHDPVMCPVRQWAAITHRILSYPGGTPSATVNTVMTNEGKLGRIKNSQLLAKLRAAAATLGPNELGFQPEDIGLHSIRSGAAMAMYLSGVPVFSIMLQGRWSSDAFLRYIRRQVQQFSAGISNKMNTADEFFTIPEASREDPRIRGHPDNFAQTSNNHGHDARRSATRPSFALWA